MGVVMPSLIQVLEGRKAKDRENLADYWGKRLAAECPEQSIANRESIILWLLGSDLKCSDQLNRQQLNIAQQCIQYRWRILHQHYLGYGTEVGYRHLLIRLAGLVTLRNKIQTWVSLSCDRQRTVIDVLQEVLQDLLQNDRYMHQQMACIAEFTIDQRLRDTLLFASIEEYSMRPIRNQPLLLYRFVNYLRRIQRGGLTQVPNTELVKMVSVHTLSDNSENGLTRADHRAIAQYQRTQELEEQQILRHLVKKEFAEYLRQTLGKEAVEWLSLYLQGQSQDDIAKKLHKSTKEIYRLREKISYHAVRIFALKVNPELVDNWLAISLPENNLGLTENQWQRLYEILTPMKRQILDLRKAGNSIEATSKQLNLSQHQVLAEWRKVYLAAQSLRTRNTNCPRI